MEDLESRPLKIFIENKCRPYNIENLSKDRISKVVELNAFGTDGSSKLLKNTYLFGLISLLNHSKHSNIKKIHFSDDILMVFADRDIDEGEEICHDYCLGIEGRERVERLRAYGIHY